ncbi:hypothetical protein ACWJJH_19015 [Endozoicomonadaceae bacterium StTr2]
MSNLNDPAVARLRRIVRYAEQPDNPATLQLWLELEATTYSQPRRQRWAVNIACTRLLLEAFADDLNPAHWRCLCLDNIYRPLMELQRLALTEQNQTELRQLMQEVRTVSNFFNPYDHT